MLTRALLAARDVLRRAFTVPNVKRAAPYAFLLVLFFVVRLAHANADPPVKLPNGLGGNELMVEPVAKAHEARNWALTGHFVTNEVDNYRFWRPQSWAWVYPLALWLKIFGVSYLSLRGFVTTIAALGFVAILILAHRRRGRRGAVVVGVMLALNFYDVAYHRVGLLETGVNTWIAWTMVFLDRARVNGYWLSAAQITFFLAFFTKLNTLAFGPLVVLFGAVSFLIWILRRPPPDAPPRTLGKKLVRFLPILQAIVLVALAAFYCTREPYMRTLIRNTGHVVLGKLATTADNLERPKLEEAWDRYTRRDVWEKAVLAVLPIVAPLAVLQMLRVPIGWIRRRDPDGGLTLLVAPWLISATFNFAATSTELRFKLGTIAPATLLAGLFIVDAYLSARAFVMRRWPRMGRAWAWGSAVLAALVVCVSFLAHDLARYVRPDRKIPPRDRTGAFVTMWFDRKYDIVRANRALEDVIGDRPGVIVGSWAGPTVFETPYLYYYVRSEFNSSRHALANLGLTHVLLTSSGNDFTGTWLRRRYPNLNKLIERRASFAVRGRPMQVYEVVGEMTE